MNKTNSKGWSHPTKFIQRFGDAMQLLCNGNRPPDQMLLDWLNPELDSMDLQEFAIAHGPVWGQGIVVIDAALVLADSPTEGVEHEMRNNAAQSNLVKESHQKLSPDVRDVPWISNCAGEIFLENDQDSESELRIGHFQGDAKLAAFTVHCHNEFVTGKTI